MEGHDDKMEVIVSCKLPEYPGSDFAKEYGLIPRPDARPEHVRNGNVIEGGFTSQWYIHYLEPNVVTFRYDKSDKYLNS